MKTKAVILFFEQNGGHCNLLQAKFRILYYTGLGLPLHVSEGKTIQVVNWEDKLEKIFTPNFVQVKTEDG